MSDIAIRVEHLSKKYRLGVINNGTLIKDMQSWIALKKGKEDPHSIIGENKYANTDDYFWALKDISLDIKQGDRVGIIGKNGAGKSTLLKLLSRITSPTEGTIRIKGKIASLLEVGTGFHGELTGRENIYLNGTILGMKKRRIDQILAEIIDFSGIGQHIDTPVKRYSSGMYVRLAFAVAAHLDSDILIADEVLAVGDAEFQKKALGKMQDLSTGQGRTVLFVSHNMGTIMQLCAHSILLKEGKIIDSGLSSLVIERYYNSSTQNIILNAEKSNSPVYIKDLYTCNKKGERTSNFAFSENVCLKIIIAINKFDPIQWVSIALLTSDKRRVFSLGKKLAEFYKKDEKELSLTFTLKGSFIAPMNYSFLVALDANYGAIIYDSLEDTCGFKIYDNGTEFAAIEGFNYGCIVLKDDEWSMINS